MEKHDDGLKVLLEQGKEKGYLTYSQVNDHLPDDDANPEKIDQLLMLLESEGVELIDEADAEEKERAGGEETESDLDLTFMEEDDTRRIPTRDPIRAKFNRLLHDSA